ncbi:response regulator [Kitasatospora sp. NPDC056731]|uniref:response regulator n=1 Tax=Kitasatospora sp. NPDC056731 TaxID=3155422 RepID=UPI003424B7FD
MDERPAPGADPAEQALRHLLAGPTAVRDGDFATRPAPTRPGVLGEIATVFNTMADQLSAFAGEVTRVAREVGSEGQPGGQARAEGGSGTWKRLLHAPDGRAGLDLLRTHPETDLVLMDVMMPGLDGYTAIAAIRADERCARLPVSAVTAKAMPGDQDKSLAADADDHVTEPVDTRHLLGRMQHWLDTP